MKKLLIALGLVASLGVSAQNFVSVPLMNVSSLAITNLAGYTNISSYGVYASNTVGQVYTNLNGVRVVVAAGNSSETAKLTKDVDLVTWDRNGNLPPTTWEAAVTNTPHLAQKSNKSLFLRIVGQSGANAAVTFIFVPVCDGVNESTATADAWSVAVTANTTTPVTLITNVPAWKWPGCKTIRLKSITNADTDASSRVDVLAASINGPVP